MAFENLTRIAKKKPKPQRRSGSFAITPGSGNTRTMEAAIQRAGYANDSTDTLAKFLLAQDPALKSMSDILTLGPSELSTYLRGLGAGYTNTAGNHVGPGRSITGSNTYRGSTREVPYTKPTEPFVFSFQNLNKLYPGPAHFYDTNLVKERFVLPVPPSDISVTTPNDAQTISTISGIDYSHAGNISLEEVSFEGFFPFVVNDGSPLPDFLPSYLDAYGGVRDPSTFVSEFTTAMRANQPLLFSIFAVDHNVVPTSEGCTIIKPVAVTVNSFDWALGNATGGTRQDITYTMTLRKWRRQSISVSNYVRK